MRRRTNIILGNRRGISSVIAMMYLILFSTLAIGAFAGVTTAVQVAYNEAGIASSRAAAESGMEFMRYQLAQLNIPYNTAPGSVFTAVYTQLSTALTGTLNLGNNTVFMANGSINIPAQSGQWIALDATGAKFAVSITQDALNSQELDVKVTGQGDNTTLVRAILMKFALAQRASSIFNYGVANRGSISMIGNTKIVGATDPTKGSVLSANTDSMHPLTMTNNTQISGDVSFVEAGASVSTTGSPTVAGYTPASPYFAQHVHSGVTPPDFPTVDTTVLAQYATNAYVPGSKNLVNTVLPPGNYSFSGNTTIQGVLLIQTPATVSFSGNLTIQGAIVVADNPVGLPATNTLKFAGNVTASSISTLPANSNFPAGERALTGAFLEAPDVSVTFSGNFGSIAGSMIASNFTFSGNAGGTVYGTVIGMDNLPLSMGGNSDILIASTGTTQFPPGVFFGSNYAPLSDTYEEVLP